MRSPMRRNLSCGGVCVNTDALRRGRRRGYNSRVTIGELARSAGVPTTTVRYYERAGLLREDWRSRANYREYCNESLQRLRFIRSAQSIGLSVRDVLELLHVTDDKDSPCDEVQALLQRRLAEVRQKMKDLKRLEKTLARAVKTCCTPADQVLCAGVKKRGRK